MGTSVIGRTEVPIIIVKHGEQAVAVQSIGRVWNNQSDFLQCQGTDTTYFLPFLHPYIMGVWISVQEHIRVQDVLFMPLNEADPSGATLWAGCQIVVDSSAEHQQTENRCVCVSVAT